MSVSRATRIIQQAILRHMGIATSEPTDTPGVTDIPISHEASRALRTWYDQAQPGDIARFAFVRHLPVLYTKLPQAAGERRSVIRQFGYNTATHRLSQETRWLRELTRGWKHKGVPPCPRGHSRV